MIARGRKVIAFERVASSLAGASWQLQVRLLNGFGWVPSEFGSALAGATPTSREPSTIAAVLEKAGLPPQRVPAALALAAQFRNDLGRDAVRGDALAAIVHRIELSPIRRRVILSAAAAATGLWNSGRSRRCRRSRASMNRRRL